MFPVRCVPVWRGQGWCGGSGSGGCWKLGFGGVTSCASWAGPFGHAAPGAPVKWGWQIWLCLLGSPACPNHVTPVFSCSSADPIPEFLGSPLPPWLPRVSSCPFWTDSSCHQVWGELVETGCAWWSFPCSCILPWLCCFLADLRHLHQRGAGGYVSQGEAAAVDTEGDGRLHRGEVHQLLLVLERWQDVQRPHPQIQVGRKEQWGGMRISQRCLLWSVMGWSAWRCG